MFRSYTSLVILLGLIFCSAPLRAQELPPSPRLAALSTPAQITPAEGASIAAYKIIFHWSKVRGAKQYQLALWMDGMRGYKLSKWQKSTAARVTIKSGRGSIMKWMVRARGSQKKVLSAWSEESYFYLAGACVASLVPQQQKVAAAGGWISLTVNTVGGTQCAWRGYVNSPWVVPVTAMTDKGPQKLEFAVYKNPSATSRSAVITVDGMNAYVTQEGAVSIVGLWNSFRVRWSDGTMGATVPLRLYESGYLELNQSYSGSYTLSGNQISIRMVAVQGCPAGHVDTLLGAVVSSNSMTGTYTTCTGRTGTWTAAR